MPTLKPYPSYRQTDLPWLGQIPSNWDVLRVKYSTYVKARVGWQGLTSDEFIDEGPILVTGTDFDQGNINWQDCYHVSEERYAQDPYIMLKEGDLLITKDGTIGKIAIVKNLSNKATLNSGVFVTRPLKNLYLTEYLYWVLSSDIFTDFIDLLKSGTTINHLYQNTFVNFAFPKPSVIEQQAIAAHLDLQTAKIDALIAKKQRLLDLLAEQRAALISQAVTKGLPKIKTSEVSQTSETSEVSWKDSGVAWLGQVPSHWEVSKLGYVSISLQTGPFGSQIHSGEYVSGGIPLINPAHIKDGKIYPSEDTAVDQETWKKLSRHELLEGDIVFARRGEMGRCALVTGVESGWLCGTGSIRVRPNKSLVLPEYLRWVLSTKGISDWLLLESVGTTMDNLNTKILASIPLPLPPIKEQEEIVENLDYQTKRLTDLATKVETAIERLREYLAALISSAVTGKIKVT